MTNLEARLPVLRFHNKLAFSRFIHPFLGHKVSGHSSRLRQSQSMQPGYARSAPSPILCPPTLIRPRLLRPLIYRHVSRAASSRHSQQSSRLRLALQRVAIHPCPSHQDHRPKMIITTRMAVCQAPRDSRVLCHVRAVPLSIIHLLWSVRSAGHP
jgi:hypothetical protein